MNEILDALYEQLEEAIRAAQERGDNYQENALNDIKSRFDDHTVEDQINEH